jgi:hypothetical protein
MKLNPCHYEAESVSYQDLKNLEEKAYYQIKFDGTHICLKYENTLKIHTRKDIPHDKSFQELFMKVPNIEEVINYIKEHDNYIIHGELVHKKTSALQIHQNEIPQFVVYDVFDKELGKYIHPLRIDSRIWNWFPDFYFNIDDLIDIITREKLEGLVAKIYNPISTKCKEGKNFNMCLFKYKPYFSVLGVIFKPIKKEIDVRKLAFTLGEIDNDLKNGKNDWYINHPELYNFFIQNKDKILQILQDEKYILQIQKDTHLDIMKIIEYIKNFKE